MVKCSECDGLGEVPEPVVTGYLRAGGRLERGWKRTWLIGQVARSEGTDSSLAIALDCSPSSIRAFRLRHAAEIEALRTEMSDQISRLWIADKLNRLAEMQTDVEDINSVIAGKLDAYTPTPYNPLDPASDGASTPAAIEDLPAWLRTKAMVLRAAADELGQIPHRVQMRIDGGVVTYKIENVDMDRV